MGKPQFRFWKYFACNVLAPKGISGRNFVKGVICTLKQTLDVDESHRNPQTGCQGSGNAVSPAHTDQTSQLHSLRRSPPRMLFAWSVREPLRRRVTQLLKICRWQAPSSKLWTGETDMQQRSNLNLYKTKQIVFKFHLYSIDTLLKLLPVQRSFPEISFKLRKL